MNKNGITTAVLYEKVSNNNNNNHILYQIEQCQQPLNKNLVYNKAGQYLHWEANNKKLVLKLARPRDKNSRNFTGAYNTHRRNYQT